MCYFVYRYAGEVASRMHMFVASASAYVKVRYHLHGKKKRAHNICYCQNLYCSTYVEMGAYGLYLNVVALLLLLLLL